MKKKLTEDSFKAVEKLSTVSLAYLKHFGFLHYPNGNVYWVRSLYDDGTWEEPTNVNFLDLAKIPELRSAALLEPEHPGTATWPLAISAYNTFARCDKWSGGYVQRLGYVGVPAASVDYGCSLFTSSWIRRGEVGNEVSVADFYRLKHENRWRGGNVDTWGYVSTGTSVLGTSTATIQTVPSDGMSTLATIANVCNSLGRNIDPFSLKEVFKAYSKDGVNFEIDDYNLGEYMRKQVYHYFTYNSKSSPNIVDLITKELRNHRSILARIVKETRNISGRDCKFGYDVFVVDYNWAENAFTYIDPVLGGTLNIPIDDLLKDNIEVLFYIYDRD